ncbi:B12-binding domain-containing radical SAM protein [Candidatus Omnitrophota bacterium]
MKVLLVMPLALPAYLFQLAALSAFLKSKGHVVRYEELLINGDIHTKHLERLGRVISEFSPDIIGFSSYEMSFNWIRRLSEHIKKISPEVPIVVGGYYASLCPEEVIRCPSIDIVCIGEGEYPLLELLDSLSSQGLRKQIDNLWFKEGGRIIKNPLRNLISELDDLPFVDRESFSSDNRKKGILEIMASRGCPFDCTNCSNHALKKIYAGKGAYVRHRSVENVLKEISWCLESDDFKAIHFEDDMFSANQSWLRDFCYKYKTEIGLPFVCNIRPDSGSSEVLNLLKESGCIQISIGLEAGDEKMRCRVLGRDIPNQALIQVFRDSKRIGLLRKSFNMVGLPYETLLTLWRTIWMNLKLAPDAVQTSVYYPFKGTALGDECYRNGWVDLKRKERLSLYANDTILNLPGVSRSLIRMAKWLNSATALRSGNLSLIKTGIVTFAKHLKSSFRSNRDRQEKC